MNASQLALLLLISGLLIAGCTSGEGEQNQLDYAAIPLIEVNKEFSITESDDYIPGQITRVMVAEDGSILVSQRGQKSIHQFDSLGNYMTRVARTGRGPGELTRNANAHFNGNILVMSNNNAMLTEYRPNENGIFEYQRDYNHRLPGPLSGIRSEDDFSSFYVRVDSVRIPFGKIPAEFTTDFIHLVKIAGDSLQVQEKILSLKRHSSYVQIVDGGNGMRYSALPYRYSDYFIPLPEQQMLVQRPRQSLIQVYDEDLNITRELKLNVKDRPVTEEDMQYHFPDLNGSERSDRRALINDIKPPFMRVLMDDQNRFWLLTDETEKGKEYVILSYEGEPLGRILLPAESTVHAVKNNKLYLVNSEEGGAVEVHSADI